MMLRRCGPALLAGAVVLLTAGEAAAQKVLFTFDGDSPDDHLGTSVSGAGDVNNDGYDDLIAGAPHDDNNGTDSGSARVYSGKDGLTLYTFYGDSLLDRLGTSVSGAGDVNNDGYDDVITGAPCDDNNGADSGSARVYSGKDGTVLYMFIGTHKQDVFGYSVSGAGDVNHDGYADVVVGAYGDSSNGALSGSARVCSGKDGSVLRIYLGIAAPNRFGYSVSGAADVDNDGYVDLIAGAPHDDNNGYSSGTARVFSGKNGNLLHMFAGDSAGDRLGWSVSGAGDVNLDGYADLIAGAPYDDDNGTQSGSARVYCGRYGTVLYTFFGDSESHEFGQSVSGAGDVDNDGYADVIAGTYQYGVPSFMAGYARVFSGKDGATFRTFSGDSSGDAFGCSVSGAGDVDNDGFDDLIVGAAYDDNNGSASGSARVFSGRCGAVTSIGTGCRGSGAVLPFLTLSGCPTPGGAVSLEITKGLGGALSFLFLGAQQGAVPLGGLCTLYAWPPIGPIVLAPLSGSGPGTGSLTLPVTLPVTTALGTVIIQAFIQDAGGTPGFSNTNGLKVTIL